MLNQEDINYLKSFKIHKTLIDEQIRLLNKSDSFLNIYDFASIKNGIKQIENPQIYEDIFNKKSENYKLAKFVPASGAATRMFKRYITYNLEPNLKNLNDGDFYSVKNGLKNIKNFAFYKKLKSLCTEPENLEEIVEKILYSGLNYANLPKGLLDFHNYPDSPRTAFEEHLHEANLLAKKPENFDIHLTVSPEFLLDFHTKLEEINEKTKYNFNLSFSEQEVSTNTISTYANGDIVRNNKGDVLLRPGGHGSLLTNLNKLNADIIFIKNIDNLTHGDYLEETILWKKVLAGVLIEIAEKIKEIHFNIKNNFSKDVLDKAKEYLEKQTNAIFENSENLKTDILNYINRPIRVCGMVKNTGEPGGGPFWVKDKNGKISLQIVEKAQINLEIPEQADYFANSSHFNPVDLVCYVKNPEGEKFELKNFVDKDSSFVSEKTHQGKNIKVLEHPGLWNGSMSDWISVFVELPLITFNPVKELNDLLRKEHQAK
ncbi:MAG: DUF4301 family protein [Bacteroidales bacterium]|nr:DUF4301 family protein [Bacteroidales bacterium]MDY0313548.1 DUF4301 family protein [Bacteroidales bacterium]